MKQRVCVFVLLLIAVLAVEAVAGGPGGYGRGGHYGGRGWYGGTQVFIWGGPPGTSPGLWSTPYRYYIGGVNVPMPVAPRQTYWLYCPESGVYYPYSRDCPGGWVQVEPSAGNAK
jgi:hypothetical protein